MNQPAVKTALDYLHPHTLSQVTGIELRARMIVEGFMTGMHRSPYRGYSVEFAEHRPYTPGDDLRHLDWKVYGRTDKLQLKQYVQETNLDMILAVDASGSMGYAGQTIRVVKSRGSQGKVEQVSPAGQWRKFDHATAAAAAMSYLALHQQDRAGLVVFADKLLDFVKPSSSRSQWRTIVDALRVQPVDQPTSMGRVCDELVSRLRHRSVVVILSDFFDDDNTLAAGLSRLSHRRHDVMLLQTLDHQELDFGFQDPLSLLGMEAEGKVDLDPRALRKAYLEALNEHIQSIRATCRKFGFEHEIVDTSMPLGPLLSEFLTRRGAKIKK